LGINAHDPRLDQEGEVCFYEVPEDPVVKVLKITCDNGDFILQLAMMQDEKIAQQKQIRLRKGQFIVI